MRDKRRTGERKEGNTIAVILWQYSGIEIYGEDENDFMGWLKKIEFETKQDETE